MASAGQHEDSRDRAQTHLSQKFSSLLRDRTEQLISRIKPAQHSEARRKGVADFVTGLIVRCYAPLPVSACTFGSVPLKTYLPDGDIDLSIFTSEHSLRDTWAIKLQGKLEEEQKNPRAQYMIGEINVINAEVKLLKCLVDNIVVDISFNQIGGLCTLTFLESIDRRVDQDHFFKKSIILVKAWCYYESRVLGAHHGLISTYALETLVLYIFNCYHRQLSSPLEVLHRFLIEFSEFDWEHYCLSIQGPIPLASFPDFKVESTSELLEDPLLPEEEMSSIIEQYSSPQAISSSQKTFVVKSFNIMDQLLHTNNLGRSVSKANFLRIRRAFGHGAKTLASIMEKDGEQAVEALDNFFRNAWNAQRPHRYARDAYVVPPDSRSPHSNQHNNHLQHHPFTRPHNSHQRPMTPGMSSSPEDPTLNPEDPTRPSFLSSNKATSAPPSVIDIPVVNTSVAAVASAAYDSNRHAAEDGSFQHAVLQPLNLHSAALPHSSDMLAHAAAWEALRQHTVHSAYAQQLHAQMGAEALQQDQQHVHQSLTLQQAAWNAAWLAASGFNKPASQQVPETSTERTPISDPLTEKDANEESSDAGLLASEASFADDSKGLASEASFAPALAVSIDSLDQEQNPAGLDPAGESVMDPGPVGILPPPPSSIPPLLLQVRPPEPAVPRPSVDLYHPSTSPTYSPRKSSLHASEPHDRPTGRSLQTSPKAARTVATFIPLHQQGSGFLPSALQGMQYLLPHPHQGYLFCPQLQQHQHLQHQHLNFQPFVNNHGTSFKSGHQSTDSLTQTSVMSHPANTMQPEMKQASASGASGDNVGKAQASGDEGRDISEGLITLPAGIKDDNSHVEEAVGPRSKQEMEKSVTSPSVQPGQLMLPPAVIWQQADQLQLLEQGALPLIFTPTSSIASYVRPPYISDSVGAVHSQAMAVPSQTMAGVHQVVDPAMSDIGLLNLVPTAQQAAASSSGVPGSMMPQAPAAELLTPPASTEFSGSFEHEDVDFPGVVTLNPDQSDLIASNREPSLSCQDVLLPSVALAEPVAEAAVQQPFALHEPHLIPGFGMYLSQDGMEHSLALLAGTSPPSRLPVNLPPPPPPALAHNIQHSPPSWSFPAAYQRLLQQQQQVDARALNAYHNQNHQMQLQQHQQYQQQYQQYISDNALSTSPTASQQGRRSNASVSGQSDSSSLEMMLSRRSHPDSDTLAGDWERLTNSLHVARFCLTSAAPAAAAAAAAASPMSPTPADPAVLVPSPSPDVSNLTHLAGSTENCADFSLTVLGSASPEQPSSTLTVLGSASPEQPSSTVHITPSLTAHPTGHDQTEQYQTHLDSEGSSTILHEAGKELSFSDCSSQTIDPGSAGDATAAAGLPAEAVAPAALAMTSVTAAAAAAASNASNHVDPSPLPASGLVEARRLVDQQDPCKLVDQQDPIKVMTGEMNSSLSLIHDAPAGPLIHPYQVPALLSTPVNPDNTPRPVIFPPLHDASDIESSVTAAAFVTPIPPPPPPPPPASVLPFLGSKPPLNGSSTSSASTSDGTALGRRPQAAVMSRSNSSAASFNHAPPRPARFVSMPPSTSGQGSHQQHLPSGTTSGSAGGNVNLDQQWQQQQQQQQRHLKGLPFSRESMPIYLSGHQTGTHPGTGEHAGITRHLERVMSSDPPQRGQQLHPAMMALQPFGVGLMPYYMPMPMSAEAYNAAAANSVHQQQRQQQQQQQQAHHQLSAVMPQLHALQVPGGVMMMSPALPVMDLSGLNMATLAHLGMPLIPATMGSMQAASSSAAVMWQQQQQAMSLMPMLAGSIPLSSSGSAPPSVDQTAALPSQAYMRRRGSSASGGGGGNSIEGTMSSNSGRISPSVSFTSSNGSAPPPHCPLVGSYDASGRFQQQHRRPVLPMPRSHPIQAQQTGSPYSTMPPPLPPQQYHQQPQQKQLLLAAPWEDAAPFHNTASPTAAPLLNLVPADTAASVVSRHPQSSGGHVLSPGAEMPLRRVSADVGGGTRIPANMDSGLSTLPTGIASHQSLGGSKRLPAPPTAVAAVLSGADIERLAAQQAAAAAATAGGLPAGLERIPPSNDDIQPGTTSQLRQRSRQNLSVLTSAHSADPHLGDHHATEVSLLPYSPGTAVAAGASPVLSGSSQLLGSTGAPHPVVSFTHMSVDSLTSRGGAATASSSSTLPHYANTARSFSLNHRADSSLAAAAAAAGVTTSENALYIPAQAQQYLQQAPTASGLQTRQHRLTSETGLAQGRSDREAGTTRGDAQLLRKSAGGPEQQQQQHVKKGAVFAGNTRHSGSTTVAGTVTVLPLSPGSTGSGSFSAQGALHQSDAGVGAQHKQQQQQHAMYQRRSHHAGDGNEGRAHRQAKDGLRRQRPTNVSGDVSFNSNGGGGLSNSRRHSMDHLIPSKVVEAPLPLSDMSEFPALGCSIPAADTRDSAAAGRRGGRGGEESFTAPTTPTVTTPSSPASAITQVYSAGAAGGTL